MVRSRDGENLRNEKDLVIDLGGYNSSEILEKVSLRSERMFRAFSTDKTSSKFHC